MQFLYPAVLWGLLALLIPIIIHLFYFRRFKKVYFSNVKFLKEIKEETSSRNKLKNFLILLARLLALAALILAFAQPFLPKGNDVQQGTRAISIFLDNSFSMKALSSDIPLFDKAKQKAKEIVSAYSNEDQFQIISHDFKVKQQRLLTKEDAINAIDEINIGPAVKTLDRIYIRQSQALENAADINSLFVLSDFQKSISDFNIDIDSSHNISFVPFQSVQERNVGIDTVYLASPVIIPSQNNQLIIKTTNHSDEDAENVRLTVQQNGISKPLGQIDIKARSSSIDTANISVLKNGWQDFNVNIKDYPVQFDDTYLVSYEVPQDIKVLSLNDGGGNKYLKSVFNSISYFNFVNKSVSGFQYSELKNYNLVILNDISSPSSGLISEISEYVINGGNLLIFPPKSASITAYNNLLNSLAADNFKQVGVAQKEVSKINTNDYIFSDVYLKRNKNLKLPITQTSFTVSNYASRGRINLLDYRDGSPFLMKYKKGNGFLYLCASPLDAKQNDLVLNAEVFVPMVFKMALAKATASVGSYTIGKNRLIEADKIQVSNSETFKITGPKEFIPKQNQLTNKVMIDVMDQIEEPGIYKLNYADKMLMNLAFNYDRKESDLSYYSADELRNKFEKKGISIIENAKDANFTELIGEKEKGVSLWKWCLIFALIFLALESLIIRLWKK